MHKKLTKKVLYELLSARFDAELPTQLKEIPQPSLLKNADIAAKKIADAIRAKKHIALVGDYDVDGVSATSLTTLFFREIGVNLEVIIPNRFSDGYGVSPKVIERLHEPELIFSVDNGIAAFAAANLCKERGIELIITDHHTPSDTLPDALIVDPKLEDCAYPFKEICGTQVIWLVLALVKKELNLQVNMSQYLPILALAIVADVMPLVGINRTMVQQGLKMMSSSKLPAFVIMREFLNKERLSSEDIGFQIAPRLNSAGRLEDASIALNFLTANNERSAYEWFEMLDSLNTQRKETEAEVTEMAMKQVNKNDKVIVVAGEEWHEGVVGIVASRLVSEFEKPAIVLSITNGIAKGSARSLGDVDLFGLISTQKELLNKFGGHKMAAGMSLDVDKIDTFRKNLNAVSKNIDDDAFKPKEEIMGILESSDIDLELLNIIDSFEPYGEANTRPRFYVEDAQVLKVQFLGKDKAHTKLSVKLDNQCDGVDLLAFRRVLSMPQDKKMSFSYTLNKNEFMGNVNVQLILERVYN